MPDDGKLRVIDKYRTIIITGAFLASGIILLIFGYYTDPAHHVSHPFPFLAFLLQQMGAVAIFSGVYTSITDYFVRKNFEKRVKEAIDFVRLDQSIRDFGLAQIRPKFVWEDALQAISQSSSVHLLVLRSRSFLEGNYTKLLKRLQEGSLSITVLLPNPANAALISMLAGKMSTIKSPQELADSIVSVVDILLRKKIYDQLKPEHQPRLKVLFVNKYPLYSAYLFDRKQFWYVPYHYRNDHQDLPVFVFESGFEQSEVYRDFDSLLQEAVPQDLSKALAVPALSAQP